MFLPSKVNGVVSPIDGSKSSGPNGFNFSFFKEVLGAG